MCGISAVGHVSCLSSLQLRNFRSWLSLFTSTEEFPQLLDTCLSTEEFPQLVAYLLPSTEEFPRLLIARISLNCGIPQLLIFLAFNCGISAVACHRHITCFIHSFYVPRWHALTTKAAWAAEAGGHGLSEKMLALAYTHAHPSGAFAPAVRACHLEGKFLSRFVPLPGRIPAGCVQYSNVKGISRSPHQPAGE
jgi:hypothetical protein